MNSYRLWDVEKTESIPLEHAREGDGTLFIATVSASLMHNSADPVLLDRARRILEAEFALIELADGTTTLVERISEPSPADNDDDTQMTLEYLTVG